MDSSDDVLAGDLAIFEFDWERSIFDVGDLAAMTRMEEGVFAGSEPATAGFLALIGDDLSGLVELAKSNELNALAAGLDEVMTANEDVDWETVVNETGKARVSANCGINNASAMRSQGEKLMTWEWI